MRRPGLWVANGHPGDPSQMLSWRPGALTSFFDYMGINGIAGYKAANPTASIIIRFQHPFNWRQDPAGFARSLGEQVASKWPELKALDPYVYFANELNLHYENGDRNPANQPFYASREFYQQYAAWVRLTADVIKSRVPEMKLVTPPFAYGHSEDGAPDAAGQPTEGWAGYDYLYETVRDYFGGILTFHSYWGHAGGSQRDWLYDPALSSWYAFRWRRLLKLFETRYNLPARLIIDEAGNFGASDPDFTDQILYHAQQCLSDARVIAVTYFLWMDPTKSPGNLPNSWTQRVTSLAGHLARLRDMPEVAITTGGPVAEPPAAPAEPTIRVLFGDDSVKTMPLEEYLRAVVPAEMPALWPAEAVKAQAVASRSYAQYALEHPRHPNADICANPGHCQNFDPAKVHPRSDEALRQTKNIVALYNGQTVNGIFSANCGGHTRNNEDVFKGAPLPYLRGVPCPDPGPKRGHGVGLCQYGARALASQGYTYDSIIRHYYTGATLGPVTGERPSSVVGRIVDHTGQPVAKARVTLTGQGQSVETTSSAVGAYRFSNVPAGVYTLQLPAYHIRQDNLAPLAGQDLTVDLSLPDPSRPAIIVDAARGPGLSLLTGDWGQPNAVMRVKPPKGQVFAVTTGSKPEYGSGGFEFYATETGTYTLEIEGYRFDIPMSGQFTRLTFRRSEPPRNGAIQGVVLDHQSQPAPNRPIQLTGPDSLTLTATTNAQGNFSFAGLPPGAYTVSVTDSPLAQAVTSTGQDSQSLTFQLPAPPEPQVRLVSAAMPLSQAQALLQTALETNPNTRGVFGIQG